MHGTRVGLGVWHLPTLCGDELSKEYGCKFFW